MDRFHSCGDDDAFAFQFAHSHRPRISGDFFSMKAGASATGPHTARIGPKTKIRCRDVGEDELLGEVLRRLVPGKAVAIGPGDDCAVVEMQDHGKLLALKTDCVVEGVHFFRGTNALDVGWKAMMRLLSDFAATSAVPQFALITLIVPEKTEVMWAKELYRGLHRPRKRFEAGIVGGETSSPTGPMAIRRSAMGVIHR